MTIINEDEFRLKHNRDISFASLRKEVEKSLANELHKERIDREKTRLLRAAVGYDEFKALSSTVHLVPISKKKVIHG
jgi:hypothetical protein